MNSLARARIPGLALILGGLALHSFAADQTPPPPAKRLPPAGIAIAEKDRAELTAGVAALRTDIDALTRELAKNPRLNTLVPDVEVLHKAVDWPLRYDEFFDLKQVDTARKLLALGRERVAQLRAGAAPWTEATGQVIRGYRSKLDDSIQPYALVIPPDWKRTGQPARRLDVVLLGRGEKRTELAFIAEQQRAPGENAIVPEAGIVLTPYGRFCNATKFAGEVDVFEAMQAVRRAYKIDANKIIVRGFSMGGASAWHLAAHYPDLWAAASPGAGFAETPVYTKALAAGKPARPDWEQKLWRWYDATGYAANLRNVPTIAYAGELDPQKLASELMEKAMAAEGLKLERLVGPQTAHKYHPESKAELARRLDALAERGRNPWPEEDHLTTYTLRYPSSSRIKIMELEQSWERADVHAKFKSPADVDVTTKNVVVFNLTLQNGDGVKLTVDGQDVKLGDILPYYWLVKENGRWVFKDHTYTDERWRKQTRKMPGLSGPIDDAFMEPFLFVRPTGQPLNEKVRAWSAAEFAHATKMWRDLFRAELPVKDDTAVTAEDIASKHLILWGDASSNALIAKILASGKTPLAWDARQLTFRGKRYDAAHHAPVLVFPNPLSTQQRYIVLNSGIDFRDEAYGTNALQVPKLPDFAIVDLREAPGPRWPGKIVAAGFFDEAWK